ncbi:MAG: protease modulator HflK N-terminal domain-containing protein, partial [Candidatus Accumulibacter sp.]|nr:protease modulator HflK N-terminal domain-containing protein [Accumulibacter sp.]
MGVLMSLNEAQWGSRGRDKGGKHPTQGPPDLEELWRDLNHRISGIFDKTSRTPDGRNPPPRGGFGPKFPTGGGIGLLVCILLVVWMASGFYIVDASQRAVVL